MRDEAQLVFSIFTTMAVANVCNVLIGRMGLSVFGLVARVSAIYVFPAVIMLCIAGVWVSGGGAVGLVLLSVFGALGYLLRVMKFPVVIFIISFVLGRIWELPLTQAVILTHAEPLRLLDYPFAVGFLLAGVGLLLYVVFVSRKPAI